LIHESILTYDESLEVERELWDIWCELCSGELPLPLGGMAIRRSLPITRAIECEEILTDAVRVAHNNRKVLAKMLLQRGLIRVDEEKLDRYLDLYANENSITLSDKQIEAIDKLYELGYKHGFYPEAIKAKDYFVPVEYKEYRFA